MSEGIFKALCEAHGLPAPVAEYLFAKPRRFRADWYWPEPHKLALEVEGGVYARGRHQRPTGFLRDMEKYNLMTLMGIRLLRCTPSDVESGAVFELLKRAMGA
jgi:hypothetical protein